MVVVFPDIEVPAKLELAFIVQAFNIDGGLFGIAQNGQDDGGENGDDGDDNKEFDECKAHYRGKSFPAILIENARFHANVLAESLLVFRLYLKLDVFQGKKVPTFWNLRFTTFNTPSDFTVSYMLILSFFTQKIAVVTSYDLSTPSAKMAK